MNLGDTARSLRESFGLTQRAAAEKLGVSVVHLCNIENGKSNPSPDLLIKFRDVFGVDLYVYSWCREGDAEKLPPGMRDVTRRLTAEWTKLIETRKQHFQAQG
jgi:transcriptional regulator with XRE-family HTH domain